MTDPMADRCQIGGCTEPTTVTVTYGENSGMRARLCDRHKPVVELAQRHGVVVALADDADQATAATEKNSSINFRRGAAAKPTEERSA